MGNARVSFAKNNEGALEITDVNDYYPFRLNQVGGNRGFVESYQNYKYNGKELQETGMYDYRARFYMPGLGRWGVMDPLAEQMRRHSPYNYAFNSPINFVDPGGRKPQMYNDAGATILARSGGWRWKSNLFKNRAFGGRMGAYFSGISV